MRVRFDWIRNRWGGGRGSAVAAGAPHAFVVAAGLTAAVFAVHLLYSAFCALSWQNYLMSDYGVYTQTLYNIAHGEGFRFLADHNYLKTHLSFSLALLAPLMRLWPSPYLLIVVQWLFLAGGAAILWRVARRLGVPPVLQAALLLVWCVYPFTQSVLLSEFHGVAAYLLLIPWLLHALCFNKRMVIAPLICILGLREEAGLLVMPLLLYFARRDRWRAGHAWAAAAAGYVAFALLWLYPWINGLPLLSVRAAEASAGGMASSWTRAGVAARLLATFWMLLPVAPLVVWARGARVRLLLPVSVAWTICMASGFQRQFSLEFHYPAPLIALLAAGAVPALAEGVRRRTDPRARARFIGLTALWMAGAVIAAHAQKGFILGGGRAHAVYAAPNIQARALRAVTRDLPRDGLLLTSRFLAPLCAARPRLTTWRYWKPDAQDPDWILFRFGEQAEEGKEILLGALDRGAYGVYRQVFPYILLKKGYPPARNRDLLAVMRSHTAPMVWMAGHAGEVRFHPEAGLVRHWSGAKTPATVALGHAVRLPAGRYEAHFLLSLEATEDAPAESHGTLGIYPHGAVEALASAPIEARADEEFHVQMVRFALAAETAIEPRVEGGGTALWLKQVGFYPAPAAP